MMLVWSLWSQIMKSAFCRSFNLLAEIRVLRFLSEKLQPRFVAETETGTQLFKQLTQRIIFLEGDLRPRTSVRLEPISSFNENPFSYPRRNAEINAEIEVRIHKSILFRLRLARKSFDLTGHANLTVDSLTIRGKMIKTGRLDAAKNVSCSMDNDRRVSSLRSY
jgi:hypothetical protein